MRQGVTQHLKQMHEAAIGMSISAAGISSATSALIALVDDANAHSDEELHKHISKLGAALSLQADCINRMGALASDVCDDLDEVLGAQYE